MRIKSSEFMEGNNSLRRVYRESTRKLVKALRLKASLTNLLFFLDDNLEAIKNSEYEEALLTISVWLSTFILLLDSNKREWEEICQQLSTLESINSIEQWLEIRQELLEPSWWNNFLGED